MKDDAGEIERKSVEIEASNRHLTGIRDIKTLSGSYQRGNCAKEIGRRTSCRGSKEHAEVKGGLAVHGTGRADGDLVH